MNRRAVWRRGPTDPSSGVGRLLRTDAPRGLSCSPKAGLWIGVGLLLGAFFNPYLRFGLPALLLYLRYERPGSEVSALGASPAPGAAFACRVEIRREGTVYGIDEGVLTFVDGWLHFIGQRTDFAFTSRETRALAVLTDGCALGLFGETLIFSPSGVWGAFYCRQDGDAAREALTKALRVWRNATDVPGGDPVFPPRGAHSSGLAQAWRDAFAALTPGGIVGTAPGRDPGFDADRAVHPVLRLFEIQRLACQERRALTAVGRVR